MLRLGQRRHQDRRDVARLRVGADALDQGEAVHAGHFDIGEYQREINLDSKEAYSAYFKLDRSSTKSSIGKQVLGGNVETYEKMGIEKVKVTANIDVGGYAWARYGYVPNRDSWSGLQDDMREKVGGGGDGYQPESWAELSSDERDEIENAWKRDTYDDFENSETESWHESGADLAQAKTQLADNFSGDVDKPDSVWLYKAAL